MNCPMCYTRTDEFKKNVPRQLMPFELFQKIIDECVQYNIYSIRLSLRGEPFIHPDICRMIAYAREKGIREISTLSNGLALSPEMFEQAMNAGLTWLTLSIDGTGSTYESIRKPAKFDDIARKVKQYAEIKKKNKKITPVIKLQSVWPAIKDNPEEYYRLFSPYVDSIASNPLIDYLGKDDVSTIDYEPDFDCPVLYQRLVIGSDGSALLCSNDELGKMIIGNANNQSLYQIWHGEHIQNARELHRIHIGYREIDVCRHCYLPRKTRSIMEKIGNKKISVDEYIGRTEKIGE